MVAKGSPQYTTKTILALVLVGFLLLVLSQHAEAAKMVVREKQKKGGTMPPDWRSHMHKLSVMMNNDAEYHFALQQFSKESGEMPVEYCLIDGITCNANGQMTEIEIVDVDAEVFLFSVPKTVSSLSFVGGFMKQSLSTLSTLPVWVKKISFVDVKFLHAVGPEAFELQKGGLRELRCVGCGIKEMDWSKVPSLMSLDLSRNNFAQLPFEKLPKTLTFLNVSGCGLNIDVTSPVELPPSLHTMDVSHNNLHGAINWNFPSFLENFYASNNKLSGEAILEKLPVSSVNIHLANNALSGKLGDLSTLSSLSYLDVSGNQINAVAWTSLPAQLKSIRLSKNLLSGKLSLQSLPIALGMLDVSENNLSGSIDTKELPASLEYFDISHNKFSGPIDLTQFSSNMRFVFIHNNKFTGSPDVTRLPVDLRSILFGDNDWDSLMPPEHDPLDDL